MVTMMRVDGDCLRGSWAITLSRHVIAGRLLYGAALCYSSAIR